MKTNKGGLSGFFSSAGERPSRWCAALASLAKSVATNIDSAPNTFDKDGLGFVRVERSARQHKGYPRHPGEGTLDMMVRLGAKRPGAL